MMINTQYWKDVQWIVHWLVSQDGYSVDDVVEYLTELTILTTNLRLGL